MKNVLVMGINGTFGAEVAKALLEDGVYQVQAFVRDPAKMRKQFVGLTVHKGNVTNIESIRQACRGIDTIIYGVNPAYYDWEEKVSVYLENVLQVAEQMKLNIVFPGNVYVFDPKQGPDFDERMPHAPVSRLGELRENLELQLKRASERGVKVIILRMGDFIARNAKSAWLPQLLKKKKNTYVLSAPGARDTVHTWAYVPDAARRVVQLLNHHEILPMFNVFNFEGYRVSMLDMASEIEKVSGKLVIIRSFPWFVFRLLSFTHVLFRGLCSMRYLWKYELNLIDTAPVAGLPDITHKTPLGYALVESGFVQAAESSAGRVVKQVLSQ